MPRYRITGPDGAVYDVDAPDDEAVGMAVQQMFGGGAPAAQAPAAPLPQPGQPGPQIPGIDTAVDAQGRVGNLPTSKLPPTRIQNALGEARGTIDWLGEAIGGVLGAAPAVVGQGARGARQGVANIVGLPVDLMNAAPLLFNLLPGDQGATPFAQNPIGGSKSIDALLGGLGAIPEPPAPNGVVENLARRIGQEVGAAALPVGGALGAAARLGTEGAQQLPRLARMFVEPAAVAPERFVRNEMAGAASAGAGAGLVNAATGGEPGSGGDLIGALLGGGAYGLATTAGPYIGRAVKAFSDPSFIEEVTKNDVVKQLLSAANMDDANALRDAIINGRRPGEVVPGFQETLADRTQKPGLAALEYGRQVGPNSGMWNEQRNSNINAADAAISGMAPDGTPGQLRSALDTERQIRLDNQTQRTEAARQEFEAAMQRLAVTGSDTARGSDIRTALEDAKRAARGVEREAWAGIDGQVDPTELARGFDEVRAGLTDPERAILGDVARFTEMPSYWTGGGDRAADPLAAMTGVTRPAPVAPAVDIRQITTLRGTLTDAERSALAAREENRARLIGRFVDALDNYAASALPPEIMQAYGNARAVSRDLNDRFTRPTTAIAQTLAERGGAPALDPSAIPGKFTPTDRGRVQDYQALRREVGTEPRVQEAISGQIRADAAPIADNPDALDTFRSERQTMLRDFPELDQRLAGAANAGRVYQGAQQNQSEIQAYLGTPDKAGRSTVAKYLTYGDENADRAMSAVIAAKDPARAADDLLSFVADDANAVQGAKAAFWKVLERKARSKGETTSSMNGTQPWMPRALDRILNEPGARAVAERLYRDQPEHLDNLRQIADVLKNVDTRTRARAPASSGTAQGVNPLTTPETLQARFYALQTGRISPTFFLTSIAAVTARRAMRFAQKDAFQLLLDRALLNPEVASALLRDNNPANVAAFRRGARAWFGNQASTITQLLTERSFDEPQPEQDQSWFDKLKEMTP